MLLEKVDIYMQKNEIGPIDYTTHKNSLKMDSETEDLKV